MKNALWISCVLALSVACGGENPSPQPAPTPTPTPSSNPSPDMSMAPTPTPNPSPMTVMVEVGPNGGMSFSPASVTINAGDTVMWQWPAGSLPHTVTSGTPGAPDGKFCSVSGAPSVQACSGAGYAVSGPASYSHTFSAAGTFPYFCQVHGAMMTGTVVVR